MRIGIVPFLWNEGGLYQYSQTILSTLYEWKCNGHEDDFIIFSHDPDHPSLMSLEPRPGWSIKPLWDELPPSRGPWMLELLRRLVGEGPHRESWRWLRRSLQRRGSIQAEDGLAPEENEIPIGPDPWDTGLPLPDPAVPRFDSHLDAWFRSWRVQLLVFPGMGGMPFEVGFPYVLAIHDLQHRLQPEFPEVSANGEWEMREYFYRNGARFATLLVADSEVGKEDIVNFYGEFGVTADRVRILPYLPACYLNQEVAKSEQERVRASYRLPERYLFYPAQFWPHKNHARVIRALAALKREQGFRIPLACCGSSDDESRKRNLQEIQQLVRQLGLQDQVFFLGYVPASDMSGLYAGAAALVFPTFFGPTNIPPLEAWSFGCPVLTSDIRGIREQMGNAALLVDPRSVEALAAGIGRLWTDEALRSDLIALGRARLASYTPAEFEQRLGGILEEAKERVRTGQASASFTTIAQKPSPPASGRLDAR